MKTIKQLKRLTVALLVMCLSTTAGAQLEHLTGISDTSYQAFTDEETGHKYHIYVRVPPNTKEKLPTVYLLDGGNTFPMLTPYAKYMAITEELPPIITVGISYGTDDWQKGNKRSTDYTLPAKDRAHYGGAEKFHRFLSKELLPWVEANFPSDPQQRVLFGHSIGGQFVLYNAMFQPDTFAGLIASNPAIHRNVETFMQPLAQQTAKPKLFILQADNDEDRFKLPRLKWLKHWQDQAHHWQQKVVTKQGHNHMSSVPDAFRFGLKWLFSTNKNNHD